MSELFTLSSRPVGGAAGHRRVDPLAPLNTSKLLDMAKAKAPNPDRLTEDGTAFWRVQASSNVVDFYFTVMDKATLANFKADLDSGVSYQDSHDFRKNGWGQSLEGQVTKHTNVKVPETGEVLTTLEGSFYTLTGKMVNGQNTQDFIDMIEGGVWRDVSVGFYASDIRCSICGRQSLDKWWDDEDGCHHVPGFVYLVDEKKKKEELAYARIMDGHLVEVSQVYDGATPGCAVLKAEQMNEAGRLTDAERAMVNSRYDSRMKAPSTIHALGATHQLREAARGGTPAVSTNRTNAQRRTDMEYTQEELDALEADAAEHKSTMKALENFKSDDTVKLNDAHSAPTRVRALVTGVETLRATIAERDTEIARLIPLADDGTAYRADLITTALGEGVRAHGEAFRTETYTKMLNALDIEGIKALRDDWSAAGDVRLGVDSKDSASAQRRTSDDADASANDDDGENTAKDDLARRRRNRRSA